MVVTPNMLSYYGGRVNSASQVVQVLWGAGSYIPQLTTTATPSMATFYTQLLDNGALTTWCKF